MKVLTFLGLGDYETARYRYQGEVAESRYFSAALAELLAPSKMVVFLTPQSRDKHWQALKDEISESVLLEPVEIPWGQSEQELWDIFSCVVGSVEPEEEILFDITHGFRSLPFLVFLATAFLQVTKDVRLAGIVYGAFEAKDKDGCTPVFDLSPFTSLLKWLAATYLFQKTGDAKELARLLQRIQDEAHRRQVQNPPKRLRKIASYCQGLSQSLELIRPLETIDWASRFSSRSDERAETEIRDWALPFSLVWPTLTDEIHRFSSNPDPRNVDVQGEVIRWYLSHKRFPQALTLGREWIVTQVVLLLGNDDPLKKQTRNRAEKSLNYLAWCQRPVDKRGKWDDEEPADEVETLSSEVGVDELGSIWKRLTEARNDVNHAGMNPRPNSAAKLETAAISVLNDALSFWGTN